MRWIRRDSAAAEPEGQAVADSAAAGSPGVPAAPRGPVLDGPFPAVSPGGGRLRGPEENAFERYRGPLVIVLISALAVFAVMAIGMVHYRLLQAPHRLMKIAGGLVVAGFFLWRPGTALLLLPFAFPFVTWLPKSGVPVLNGMNLLLASLLVGWLARTATEKTRLFDRSPWNLPLACLLGWLAFSWLHATMLNASGLGYVLQSAQHFWIGICGLALFYMVFNNVFTWDQVRRLALLFCIGSGLGVLGLVHELQGFGEGRRVAGGLGQENVAGAFFAVTTLFILAMLSGGYRGLTRRAGILFSLGASAVGLVLPASRGAFVGFLGGGLMQAMRGGLVWILVLALLVLGFLAWAPDYVRDRIMQTQEAVTAGEGQRYEALNEDAGGRFDFWKASLKVIAANPVIGVGYGRVTTALEPYLGAARPSHNLFLEVAVEDGFPGLLLLLWVFGSAFWYSRDLLQARGFPRALGIGYGSALAALFVSNFFGGRFFDFSLAGAFAFVSALVFRARSLLLSQRAATAEEERP